MEINASASDRMFKNAFVFFNLLPENHEENNMLLIFFLAVVPGAKIGNKTRMGNSCVSVDPVLLHCDSLLA